MSTRMLLVGVLTVSDRTSKGERIDASGPELEQLLRSQGLEIKLRAVVPDERSEIGALLKRWCDDDCIDLIVTTGGTGVSPRDVTPEATLDVIERSIPGMAEAMRAAGMSKTPHAMISRAVVGIRGNTLIVNLPGSPRGAIENLQTILPALPHAIEKIQGDQKDCARK